MTEIITVFGFDWAVVESSRKSGDTIISGGVAVEVGLATYTIKLQRLFPMGDNMSDARTKAVASGDPPAAISAEAAKELYLALNYLVAVIRTPDDPVASGALDFADKALAAARG